MRLFLAIDMPAPTKDAALAARRPLEAASPPVRWSAPEGLHLTLVFLGETDEALLGPVGQAARAVAARHQPIALQLDGHGAFPSTSSPQVLWLGVGGGIAALRALQADLVRALQPLGFEPEQRAYAPHITLGRVHREAAPAQLAQIARDLASAPPPAPADWLASHITLYESQTQPHGPHYSERDTIALG
ncbi:RNA 2',3'-cyclic phosphodiesterase [Chloroflexia bacterium SDU3-3]|nr:RNA 2',3'-cyclic phosphodiesterase [Chloroflexia bacterium SDU3-3]